MLQSTFASRPLHFLTRGEQRRYPGHNARYKKIGCLPAFFLALLDRALIFIRRHEVVFFISYAGYMSVPRAQTSSADTHLRSSYASGALS
jgi:hypothetical protein